MHELLVENSHLMQKFVETENEITMEKLVLQKKFNTLFFLCLFTWVCKGNLSDKKVIDNRVSSSSF